LKLRTSLGFDAAFFAIFFLVWSACAYVFWHSPVNALRVARPSEGGAEAVLHLVNVSEWLGFAAAYLRATSAGNFMAYLRLSRNVRKGLVVGLLVGLAFVVKDVGRVLLLDLSHASRICA
jgi:hypothetical protein